MIPNKIKDLFQFIDYLHSNIENFNQYNDLLKELRELDKKRNQLNKNESFKDKLEYEKIQNEISQKFDILKQNVIHRITSKANDLKLLDNNRNANELTLSYKDITTLKEKVQPENLNEISEHKNKYLEFRKQTNKENYLSFGFLFTDLDEYIVDLFSFFSEDKNEFDFIIPVQTHFIGGNSESKTRIWNRLADLFYFQIYFETENGKVKNNDSILTPKNWEQHKDTFFKQRMETHPDSYKQDEKIKLELEGLEKLTINKTDYKILKERYRKHLINKTDEPVQETPPPNESDAEHTEAIKKLKSIWLADPKLTVVDFIQKGIDKRFWNNELQLTLQRSVSTYGTGKTFLANIFIAFKNWAIPEHLDYKEAGKVFCEVFSIEIKETTNEPYKAFSSGNRKIINEIKRTFGVK